VTATAQQASLITCPPEEQERLAAAHARRIAELKEQARRLKAQDPAVHIYYGDSNNPFGNCEDEVEEEAKASQYQTDTANDAVNKR
jgi:hypothetical protein